MRKVFAFFVILFYSCSSETDTPLRKDVAELLVQSFEENSEVIDQSIDDAIIITGSSGHVRSVAQTVNNRDAYLGLMNASSNSVYAGVQTEWLVHLDRPVNAAPQNGFVKLRSYLLPFPSGYNGPNPGNGALDLLSNEVDTRVNAGKGEQMTLESWSFPTPRSSNSKPFLRYTFATVHTTGIRSGKNPIQIGYDEFKTIVSQLKKVITVNGMQGQVQMETAIEGMLDLATPEQAVMIGLLIPAIQAVRATDGPYNAMINDLFDFTAQQRLEWDRDVRLAALLVAVDFVLSDQYDPADEITVSMQVNRQIFDAIMIMIWAIAYDLYK